MTDQRNRKRQEKSTSLGVIIISGPLLARAAAGHHSENAGNNEPCVWCNCTAPYMLQVSCLMVDSTYKSCIALVFAAIIHVTRLMIKRSGSHCSAYTTDTCMLQEGERVTQVLCAQQKLCWLQTGEGNTQQQANLLPSCFPFFDQL